MPSPASSAASEKKIVESKRDPITKWITRIVVLVILVATCKWLDTIKDRWYVFDPTKLHQLAQSAIAAHPSNPSGMVHHIISNLTSEYPSSIVSINTNFNFDTNIGTKDNSSISFTPSTSSEWVFNNAGGAMGAMYIIHASITEYLIIFGTPLGTEGHSGLHSVDNYFNILIGEQWAFDPLGSKGVFEMERYPAGSVNYMPRGRTKQYKMHKGCFALEYSRGWIPFMLPFGFLDGFTSTLDLPTMYNTAWLTAREMIKNLLVGKI